MYRSGFLFLKHQIQGIWARISSSKPGALTNIPLKVQAEAVVKESFLTGTSANYIEYTYEMWKKDPNSVHASWNSYFRLSEAGIQGYQAPPNLIPKSQSKPQQAQPVPLTPEEERIVSDHMAVQSIIRSYQGRGHLVAQLDPLKITSAVLHGTFRKSRAEPSKMVVREYLSDYLGEHPKEMTDEQIMAQVYRLSTKTYIAGKDRALPLGEILRRLENIYCKHIGAEFMYLTAHDQSEWIKQKLETPGEEVTNEDKITALYRLVQATRFEEYLAKKWPSEKRFGLEGCEVLIPAIKQIIDRSSAMGVETVIIGMAHRGRLNVLANVCRKSFTNIFTQFASAEASDQGSGDVKYHLGTYTNRLCRATDRMVRHVLIANPSHLEAVSAVVQGKTRAEQFHQGDSQGNKVMSILLHGDAAFSGQGMVFETLHLSNLPDYSTGGTIHLVINNQVGFTTDPRYSRSSPYCTDVAKVVNAPIFHVNGDEPESVIKISNICAEYRSRYHHDCVIDLIGYRRFGHNEQDQPMFTQPLAYKIIDTMKPIADLYAARLIKQGIVNAEEIKAFETDFLKTCEMSFQKAQKITRFSYKDWIDSPWDAFFKERDPLKLDTTGVNEETLKYIGEMFSSPPPKKSGMVIHQGIERILKGRMALVKARKADWALGEAFAFGTLCKERCHVRVSGQDVERGTFSHRHHVLHDQVQDKRMYRPMAYLYPDQAPYTICNSSLSEYAVLGFELGYSIARPDALVVWEAQFGDFNNTAQCIIDLFLCSGESKWSRQSGLVLLQPHGMEGMGPEHSSGRLERFLSMSDDDPDVFPPLGECFAVKQLSNINWIVANCSTPANFFHIIRRQIALPFRKPLILMTPKSLLRHPEAQSSFDDMIEGTEFQRMLLDRGPAAENPGGVKRVIFCSGKVYYELKAEREKRKLTDSIVITRVEQLTPFPFDLVKDECEKYPSAQLVWAQEEHKNMGAWTYVRPRFHTTVPGRLITYVGRPPSASPATGSKPQHLREIANLLEDALSFGQGQRNM